MAELELQINQVMSGLESLAESLGIVVDRMNRLEDTQSCYSDTIDSEEHLWRDNVSLCVMHIFFGHFNFLKNIMLIILCAFALVV